MAKILVIDDSSLSRRICHKILEEAGHAVTDATDGLAAIERYALDRPDLVLLDVTMAEMDGL
jgi:two-component system, chemotaxis family, chemotaxis protein CheY